MGVFTPVSGGPNLITNYTYDLWDNLSQVSMPRSAGTQTRTFVYSGKYLMSATNPENGTVNYTYTANGKLASKTDAKGQQIVYTYDAYLRLTQIQRYPTPGNEDACQRTLFYYDTNPFNGSFSQYAYGRPTATKYGISTGGYCANGVPYTFTEQYSYTQAGLVTNKRLAVTAGSRTANLDTSQTYDNEGKVLTVKYPDINSTGPTYTYAYDTMGRPITLTDNQSATWVSGVQYGLSGELLSLNGETRTYNSRLQLTRITGGANMEYRYSPTQNNGQITQQKDWSTGEEVTYTYDTLQRLIGAVTTDSSWGQAFTYDGFGNRTSASVTKGSAPYGNWSYNPSTNRFIGGGGYDANGNMTSAQGMDGLAYDVENRLVSVPAPFNYNQYLYQTEVYAYTPGNKRIWRRKPDGTEELYYYGISGQKLMTITPLVAANGDFFLTTLDTNLYFGSRTIVSRGVTVTLDRVGSNRAGGSRYFPYGEEQQVTAQDRDKFATYYRDSTTGLDYADQRYYANTLGRFTSPDPYMASGGPADPGSWNRYSYVGGDPINYIDPTGKFRCTVYENLIDGCTLPNVPAIWGPGCDFVPEPGDPGCGGGSGGGAGGGPAPQPRPRPAPPSPKRMPKFLQVTEDCYHVPLNGGAVTRDITYKLYDDSQNPLFYSAAVVWEHLTGDLPVSGANSPSSGPGGTFDDQQSVVNFMGQTTQHVTQTFTANTLQGAISVFVRGFNGTDYGTLDIVKTTNVIYINGNTGGKVGPDGKLIPGSYTPCP